MLDELRKKQKAIVYIVAAAFILSLGAGGIFGGERLLQSFKGNYLAKINGSKISPQEYNAKIQEVVQRYEAQGQRVDEQMMSYVRHAAWQELVDETLLKQQIKKYRIKVTDAQIKHAMQNDVPMDLQQHPDLQTNGRFDKQKYLAALNSNPQLRQTLYDYMKNYLPRKKLQDKIVKQSGITVDSLKFEFNKENDSVTGKAIWFDFNMAETVEATEAEIKKYYEDNKEKEFKKGPASRIKYLSFPIKASEEDYNFVKNEIDELYQRITGDKEDFTLMALDHSEDPGSGANGGYLGRFKKGMMVSEFEKAAFALKAGQVSKPVRTDFGWHIIKCDSIFSTMPGEEEIAASHILLKVNVSSETRRDLEDQAKKAAKLIARKGIDKAAKELKLEATASRWLAHDNPQMEGIGEHGGLFQFIKAKKAGKVSEVFFMNIGGEESYLVAQITDNVKSYYEDFAEKKLQIKYDLEKQKKIASAKDKADNFVKRVSKDKYLTSAHEEGWKIIDLSEHKSGSRLPSPVNAQLEDFDKAALALNSGQYSALINTKEGPFIIFAETRNKPDMKNFTQEKQAEIRERMENEAFNRWFVQLRKDAKIIDNRYKYGY